MNLLIPLVAALAVVSQAYQLPEIEAAAHAKTMAAHAQIHKLIVNNGKLTETHLQAITDLHGPTGVKTQDIMACAQAYGQELQSVLSGPTCQNLFGSMAGLSTANQNDATVDAFCSNPCYPGYVEALRRYLTCIGYSATDYQGTYAQITAWFDFLCTKNPATGQYCLTSWYNNLIRARGSSFQYCYFYGFDYGCCLTSMINYYTASLGADYSDGWNTYLRACNLQAMPACPRPGVPTTFVNVRWRLLGTLYSWVSTVANGQQYRYYLAQVIARHFGVRLAYVTITQLSAGSVVANFQIRGNNNTETDSFKSAALARALEAPQLTELQAGLGANGTDGGAYSADMTAATASEATVTSVYGGGNSAASLAPSVALFLGAALLALNNAREQLFA